MDDDDYEYDFAPAVYPLREFVTMTIAAVTVIALLGWAVAALIKWL